MIPKRPNVCRSRQAVTLRVAEPQLSIFSQCLLKTPNVVLLLGAWSKAPRRPLMWSRKFLEQRASTKEIPKETLAEAASPQLEDLADGLGQLFDLVVALHDQDRAENKAFDLLHAELSDYKNDFFYERIKPFARQLLFVADALQQYGAEVEQSAARGETLPAVAVKENLQHCAEQLTDALTLIEMAPIEPADAKFDPKTQRAVEVERVASGQNNQIVREVRGGWTMGGQLLRAADVVVGKDGLISRRDAETQRKRILKCLL